MEEKKQSCQLQIKLNKNSDAGKAMIFLKEHCLSIPQLVGNHLVALASEIRAREAKENDNKT